MRTCIPVKTNEGIKARVNAHFGSSPYFLIYDTANNAVKIIRNNNDHHEHGTCQPLDLLEKEKIDIVACKGMGGRAVQILNRSGIWAYKTDGETAEETIAKCKKESLRQLQYKKRVLSIIATLLRLLIILFRYNPVDRCCVAWYPYKKG